MRVRLNVTVVVFSLLGVMGFASADSPKDPLKRGAFLGAQLGPLNDQVKKEQKLETDDGVEVRGVVAGSSAEAAGLQPKDVILAVNGATVHTTGEIITTIARAKGGEVIVLDLVRDAKKLRLNVELKERPSESSEKFETIYGSVTSKAGRLRTILTKPKGEGRHPALLFIQGIGCYSVESVAGRPVEFKFIADNFTENGYVTLRVEKPGMGDSEGGPCEDVDFETELDGYRQALRMLKQRDDVDPEKVIIFGHSLGGLWAPIVASEEPVKGVAVYGTAVKPWFEYEIENRRRQLLLLDLPYSEIDQSMRQAATFLHYLYVEKQSPKEIAEKHPELADIQQEMSPDGLHMYGRSVKFMQQVAALPLSEYWSKLDSHVLAAWGKAEYVSTEADHRMLADLINKRYPGHGTFLALDGIDHGLQRSTTAKDRFHELRAGRPSEFNPLIIETLRKWADPLVKAS